MPKGKGLATDDDWDELKAFLPQIRISTGKKPVKLVLIGSLNRKASPAYQGKEVWGWTTRKQLPSTSDSGSDDDASTKFYTIRVMLGTDQTHTAKTVIDKHQKEPHSWAYYIDTAFPKVCLGPNQKGSNGWLAASTHLWQEGEDSSAVVEFLKEKLGYSSGSGLKQPGKNKGTKTAKKLPIPDPNKPDEERAAKFLAKVQTKDAVTPEEVHACAELVKVEVNSLYLLVDFVQYRNQSLDDAWKRFPLVKSAFDTKGAGPSNSSGPSDLSLPTPPSGPPPKKPPPKKPDGTNSLKRKRSQTLGGLRWKTWPPAEIIRSLIEMGILDVSLIVADADDKDSGDDSDGGDGGGQER